MPEHPWAASATILSVSAAARRRARSAWAESPSTEKLEFSPYPVRAMVRPCWLGRLIVTCTTKAGRPAKTPRADGAGHVGADDVHASGRRTQPDERGKQLASKRIRRQRQPKFTSRTNLVRALPSLAGMAIRGPAYSSVSLVVSNSSPSSKDGSADLTCHRVLIVVHAADKIAVAGRTAGGAAVDAFNDGVFTATPDQAPKRRSLKAFTAHTISNQTSSGRN